MQLACEFDQCKSQRKWFIRTTTNTDNICVCVLLKTMVVCQRWLDFLEIHSDWLRFYAIVHVCYLLLPFGCFVLFCSVMFRFFPSLNSNEVSVFDFNNNYCVLYFTVILERLLKCIFPPPPCLSLSFYLCECLLLDNAARASSNVIRIKWSSMRDYGN